MSGEEVCLDGCGFFSGGGEGREAFFLGERGDSGIEAGEADQNGTENRLEMKLVCFTDP